MWFLALFPFILQSLVIGIDEYYFHLKRGLPRWERIGHPIDTLSVLICFGFVLLVPYSAAMLKVFIALAILSCLLVTKDEFVHKHHCPASEQWLHALLFLNHPIMLGCMGIIWARWNSLLPLLWVPSALTLLFFLYQVVYWNFIWEE
jgi:hypothetical protein